ncbi:MAG: FliA/WhiG family RNA polymerase sigma factor [Oscillospiraceae bacterium]|jgi:RNA polymerase sigma factor for flagellar operon FliA|nr:FliA/WhiG family RNA polymerase sigma factor [Oscillospiraceae bacterium]
MTEDVATDNEMWKLYCQTKDAKLRDRLVIRYAGLVKGIVLKMRGIYNDSDTDDIIGHGMITLVECVDRFDYVRGIKFETFASIRIRGNVIDYLRQQDWVPRNLRKEAKKVEKAFTDLECDDDERLEEKVASYLGTTVENVRKLMSEINKFNIISYEELVYDALSGTQVEIQDTTNTGVPDSELLKKEFLEYLTAALEELRAREKLILALYYSETLKLKEIAEIIGVTESRVCQIHGESLKKLKESLEIYLK